MLDIILRTFLALGILLILARVMGRKSIAQLSLYDYVLGLVFGNIGASFAVDRSVPVADGIVSLLACTVWVIVLNFVMLRQPAARKIVDPEPIIVVYNGSILEQNLRKNYYTVNSLLELLREQEIFDPSQVKLGIIESNGQLSILKNDGNTISSKKLPSKIPQPKEVAVHLAGRAIIINGDKIDRAFEHSGISEEWVKQVLQERKLEFKDVMVALITPDGNLYVDTKDDNLPRRVLQ